MGVNVTEAWTESVGAGSVEGGALNDSNLTEGLGWSESFEASQDGDGVTEDLEDRNRIGTGLEQSIGWRWASLLWKLG